MKTTHLQGEKYLKPSFGLTCIVHTPQFKKTKKNKNNGWDSEISADSAWISLQFSKMKIAQNIRFLKRRIFYGKKIFMPDEDVS